MADQKLSQLTNIMSLADTNEFYVTDPDSKAVDYSVLRDAIRNDTGEGSKLGLGVGRWNAFTFYIARIGATTDFRHYFRNTVTELGSLPFAGAINGASTSVTTTPSGNDSTTAFAAGAKISSASTNRILLNTASMVEANNASIAAIATMQTNTTDTDVRCVLARRNVDVNGTTRYWLTLEFYDAATHAAFNIDTTNFDTAEQVAVQVVGFLPDYS